MRLGLDLAARMMQMSEEREAERLRVFERAWATLPPKGALDLKVALAAAYLGRGR